MFRELIELHPGEFFSIFRGETVPSASFFIPDNEKSCSSDPVVINRYISVDAPRLDRLRRLVPPYSSTSNTVTGKCQCHHWRPDCKTLQKKTKNSHRAAHDQWIHSSNALQDVRRLWQCWKSTTQISTHVKVPCGKQR